MNILLSFLSISIILNAFNVDSSLDNLNITSIYSLEGTDCHIKFMKLDGSFGNKDSKL